MPTCRLHKDTLAHYQHCVDGEDSEYGFTLRPARSRRIGRQKLADVEFADDVALFADTIEGAKLLLDRLEIAPLSVGDSHELF